MPSRYLAFIFFCLLGGSLIAQPSSYLPYSTLEQDLPRGFRHYLLPTGLELLTVEDNTSPVITLHAVVREFESFENEENDGIAWLISRMLAKANKELFLEEMVRDEARQSGILYRTWLGGGNLHLHLSFPPRYLDPAMQWMRSVLSSPTFEEEELKKELKAAAQDLQEYESEAEFFLRRELEKTVWGGEVFQRPQIPAFHAISSFEPEELVAYHRAHARPGRTLILAGGDLQSLDLKDAIDRNFADWESFGAAVKPEGESFELLDRVVLKNELAHEPVYMAGWKGPGIMTDPRNAKAAELFCQMANLPGSPLQERFVQTRLASQAELIFQPGPKASLILLRIKAEEMMALECLKEADLEVERLKQAEYASDSLLELAVRQMSFEFRFRMEKTSSFLPELADWWAWAGDFEHLKLETEYSLLTAGDLRTFSRKFLDPYDVSSGMLCTTRISEELPVFGSFAASEEIPKDIPKEIKVEKEPVKGPTIEEVREKLSNYRINFELNSNVPDRNSQESLSFIAQFLNKYPRQKVYLDGHADTQGSADYNLKLSGRRAEAVKQFLVENFRVNPGQLLTRAFGESHPAFEEHTDEDRARNRRVEVSPIEDGEVGP